MTETTDELTKIRNRLAMQNVNISLIYMRGRTPINSALIRGVRNSMSSLEQRLDAVILKLEGKKA